MDTAALVESLSPTPPGNSTRTGTDLPAVERLVVEVHAPFATTALPITPHDSAAAW
jgi:hypothetical protein